MLSEVERALQRKRDVKLGSHYRQVMVAVELVVKVFVLQVADDEIALRVLPKELPVGVVDRSQSRYVEPRDQNAV